MSREGQKERTPECPHTHAANLQSSIDGQGVNSADTRSTFENTAVFDPLTVQGFRANPDSAQCVELEIQDQTIVNRGTADSSIPGYFPAGRGYGASARFAPPMPTEGDAHLDMWTRFRNCMMYDDLNPELMRARLEARSATWELNRAHPRRYSEALSKFAKHLGTVGKGVYIEPPFRMNYGFNIHLGDQVYFNCGCVILDNAPIHIGHRTMFGPGVHIYAVNHPMDKNDRATYWEYGRPITIGDDCWIGGHATILLGVTIGDGAVIAAGAIVNRDIPPHTLVTGVPIRVVKRLSNTAVTPREAAYGNM